MSHAAAVPPPSGSKTLALVHAGRISPRVRIDVLAPLTTLLVVSGGRPDWRTTVLVVVAMVLLHAGQTYCHDVTGVDVDRTGSEPGRNQRALAARRTGRRDMAVLGTILLLAGLVCAAFVSWQVLVLMTVTALLGLGCAFEPLRLAGRPLVTQGFRLLVWGSVYWTSTLATGGGHWRPGLWFLAFVVVFRGLGEALPLAVRDAGNDAEGGRRTTVVVHGPGAGTGRALTAQALSLVPLAVFGLVHPLPAWATAAASATVAAWLYVFFGAWNVLRHGYDENSARLVHVGSLCAFTAVNVIVCAGVLHSAR